MPLIPELTMQFVIPFMFVLAIVFGILRIGKVFSGNTAVEMIIAIVIAFFSATYQPFITILFQFLPTITWFFIAMFFILFILEITGVRGKRGENKKNVMIYGILLLLLFSIVASRSDIIPTFSYISTDDLILTIGIIFIIAIFYNAYNIQEDKQKQ